PPSLAFLRSQPIESYLRRVCSKVGGRWRAVATYLNIPTPKVDYYVDGYKPDMEEAFFRILIHWRSGQGATWATLLTALRMAELKAPADELQEWGRSKALTVSCVVMTWSDAYCSESDFLL
ncbi:MAG: death domain-containing protein, partial [Gammaproteobacteria bacterium]